MPLRMCASCWIRALKSDEHNLLPVHGVGLGSVVKSSKTSRVLVKESVNDQRQSEVWRGSCKRFCSIEQHEDETRAQGWPCELNQLKPGPFTSQYRFSQVGDMSLHLEHLLTPMEDCSQAPEGSVTVALFRVGAKGAKINGYQVHCDQFFVMPSGSSFHLVTQDVVQACCMQFRHSAFEASAQGVSQGSVDGLMGEPYAVSVPSPLVKWLWWQLAERSDSGISDTRRDIELSQTILARLSSAVVGIVEQSLPSTRKRQVLGCAREYIEAHLTEALSVAELCAYTQVNLRTLERVFAPELGLSPTGYIQARRLNLARRKIIRQQTPEECLSVLALDCGFTHLGRFSVLYRQFFGESPSQTRGLARSASKVNQCDSWDKAG